MLYTLRMTRLNRFISPCARRSGHRDGFRRKLAAVARSGRSGISDEANVPAEWSPERNVAWKTPLPGGPLLPYRLGRSHLRDRRDRGGGGARRGVPWSTA